MKKYILLLIFSCVNITNIFSQNFGVSRIVFEKSHSSDQEGENSAVVMQDSFLNFVTKDELEVDSQAIQIFKQFSLSKMYELTPSTNVIIEVKNDTIWKHIIQYNKIIGDYQRVDTSGKVFYHAKFDRSMMYKEVDFKSFNQTLEVEYLPEDQKEIANYKCYKVVIRQKHEIDPDFPFDSGDTIFELYVTNEINLPVHSLLNLYCDSQKFFPLEVKIWSENLKGNYTTYKVVEIE
jgi:hypothetical protein